MVNSPNQDTSAPATNITQSETSLAVYGDYVLFGFNDSNCATNDNYSGYTFSSDGGITWSDCGSMPRNVGWFNGGDPVIGVDGAGIFYYAHLGETDTAESVIQLSTATVNPVTRQLTMNLPFAAGTGSIPGSFQDKEWMTVGRDKMVAGPQAIYLAWVEFTDTTINLRFAKWRTGVTPTLLIPSKTLVSGDLQGAYPLVDNAGDLYVFYESYDGFGGAAINFVKSTNGGNTFGPPQVVSTVVPSFNAIQCSQPVIAVTAQKAIRMNDFPQVAVGPDNTLYVVWNDGRNNVPGGAGINIFLAYSSDGGQTWAVRKISNGPVHAFFPSVTVYDKTAWVQYAKFIGAADIGNGTFALYRRPYSPVSGLGVEVQVSTQPSEVPNTNPNFDNRIANCYMGDYNQIVYGGVPRLLHAWSDNRFGAGGNNPSVFFLQTTAS